MSRAVTHYHPNGCGQIAPSATNVTELVTCPICQQYIRGGFFEPGLSHAERSQLLKREQKRK